MGDGPMITPLSARNPATQHLSRLLEPNQNLPDDLYEISSLVRDMRDRMLDRCQDGPELSTGLRKLLEAKDCFVRQALIDRETP